MHALLQHSEAPKASLRMLCAFVAMHMALEAKLGNPAAPPAQLPAVVDKLLHVLVMPACTITQAGATSAVSALHKALGACISLCASLY